MNLFEYRWKAEEEELQVIVDWVNKRIVSIQQRSLDEWCSNNTNLALKAR
jgi:hypothetical protein